MTNALTVLGGKALARRNTAVAKVINVGLALISEQLSDEVVQNIVVASHCDDAHGNVQWLHNVIVWETAHRAEYVEKAKAYYRAALGRAAAASDALDFLRQLHRPWEPITLGQASAMLHALFASITGKLRTDEAAAAKLAGCVNIFSPTNNALGQALELWEPVPMHPVMLALAITELRASKTFEPSEPELREALKKVEKKTDRLRFDTYEWLQRLEQADFAMFKIDPDGWRAAHAAADNESIFVMRDDEHIDAAYQTALNAIYEETWDDWGRRRDEIAAETAPKQIAACDARPGPKRTQKLKRRE